MIVVYGMWTLISPWQLKVTAGALEGNGRVVDDSVDVGILADSLLRSLS